MFRSIVIPFKAIGLNLLSVDVATWRPGDDHTGKCGGHTGTVESNLYQWTMGYPDEWFGGHHIMLDSQELVPVRCYIG